MYRKNVLNNRRNSFTYSYNEWRLTTNVCEAMPILIKYKTADLFARNGVSEVLCGIYTYACLFIYSKYTLPFWFILYSKYKPEK